MAGYYRRFVDNFACIAKPLTLLLKEKIAFQWNENALNAFDKLKDILCSRPLLQYPDFGRPFVLTTDASDYALGAVLSQGPVGRDLPIAYASRTLNGAELNYPVIEKELVAIVFAVKYFRPYLYGRKFLLVTDHRPLTWLYQLKDPTINSRLAGWKIKLEEYDHEIIYKPGRINANADALSRNPIQLNNNNEIPNSKYVSRNAMLQAAAQTSGCDFQPDPGRFYSKYPIEKVFLSKIQNPISCEKIGNRENNEKSDKGVAHSKSYACVSNSGNFETSDKGVAHSKSYYCDQIER